MTAAPIRSHFFIAFRVLPRERYDAITAVYGFCRRADDAVDESPDPSAAERAVHAVREELERAFQVPDESTELARAIRRFALPRKPFDDLMEGVRWDLEGRRYPTREALEEYCYRVASTVGLLCVRIFGCDDGSCDRYASRLGIALQWTNILRDVAADLSLGRVYLPAESMTRHGVTEDDLRRGDDGVRARLGALIREEASVARTRFAEAAASLPPRFRRQVLSAEIMGEVYRTLLGRVERAGGEVLRRKIRVGGLGRGIALARALFHTHFRNRADVGD